MGMVGPLFGAMQAINAQYAALGTLNRIQNAELRMMDRASNVRFGTIPNWRFDRDLAIQGEMAKVQFAAAQAILETDRKMVKQAIESTFGDPYIK